MCFVDGHPSDNATLVIRPQPRANAAIPTSVNKRLVIRIIGIQLKSKFWAPFPKRSQGQIGQLLVITNINGSKQKPTAVFRYRNQTFIAQLFQHSTTAPGEVN